MPDAPDSSALPELLDDEGYIPYYVQLKNALRKKIETGELSPGDKLPSEPELCRIYGISRSVARQALKELAYEGLAVRKQGKGTFVASPKIGGGWKLTGFHQPMLEEGHIPQTKVLKHVLSNADGEVAARLCLEPGTPVVEITRLRFVASEEDEPNHLSVTFLPYELAPKLLDADLSNQSLYGFLEKECGLIIAHGHRRIEAVIADEYQASLLGIERGAPLLKLESVSYLSDGTPVEYYYSVYRGDRVCFEVDLVRTEGQLKTQ
jgi:GntR family transcriptional regulator